MTKISRLYLILCWAIAIFILVAYPMPDYSGTKITYYDKIMHVFLYGVFVVLIQYNFKLNNFYKQRRYYFGVFSFSIAFAYALFGEWIQSYVPGRTVSVYDLLAGVVGIIIFLLSFYVKERIT